VPGARSAEPFGNDPFEPSGPGYHRIDKEEAMTFILWLIAVILVIAGIVAIIRSQILWGVVLIIVGLLVGPGGVSIFK
jgi:hypothetical protein